MSIFQSIIEKLKFIGKQPPPKINKSKNINDFIEKIDDRGCKRIYAKFHVGGLEFLSYGICNRDINDKLKEELMDVTLGLYHRDGNIYYDRDDILLLVDIDNKRSPFALVADGQHRLFGLEELVKRGKIPSSFTINVNVQYITSENEAIEIVYRLNKDNPKISGWIDEKKNNAQILTKMKKYDPKCFGKMRPKIIEKDFIEKIKRQNLYERYSIKHIYSTLIEMNENMRKEYTWSRTNYDALHKLKEKHKYTNMSQEKLDKYLDKYQIILGFDKECEYLEGWDK
jgi:hypothetical protein